MFPKGNTLISQNLDIFDNLILEGEIIRWETFGKNTTTGPLQRQKKIIVLQ